MIRVTSDPAQIDLCLAHQWIASTYWAANILVERFERACSNSRVFAAFDGNDQVGFARVVTDWATFAWLCDVFVAAHSRSRGVSRHLMEVIMADDRLQGLRHVILATKDAHGLYEKFGFKFIGDAATSFIRIFRRHPRFTETRTLKKLDERVVIPLSTTNPLEGRRLRGHDRSGGVAMAKPIALCVLTSMVAQ